MTVYRDAEPFPQRDEDDNTSPEVAAIEQDIDETRASLDRSIDLLEEKVSDTVEQVRQTFDLGHQVGQRPWVMLGFALGAGFGAGILIGGGKKQHNYEQRNKSQSGYSQQSHSFSRHAAAPSYAREQFYGEVDLLKNAALAATADYVRATLGTNIPFISDQVEKLDPTTPNDDQQIGSTPTTEGGTQYYEVAAPTHSSSQ